MEMVVYLLYPLILLTALWLWFRVSHRELLGVACKLPTATPAYPLLGHPLLIFSRINDIGDAVLDMSMQAVAKGLKTVCFWAGPYPVIVLHDIEDAQMVLNSSNTLDKGSEYEYLKMNFNSGVEQPLVYSLLTAPAHIWKVTRRHINPLFHPRNINAMMPMLNANSRELVGQLGGHVGRGPVEVMHHTMNTSLKTVCCLMFGPEVKVDLKSESFHGLLTVVEMIPELFVRRITRFWLRVDAIFQFLYRKEMDLMDVLWRNFTEKPLKISKESSKRKKERRKVIDLTNEQPAIEEPLNIVDVYSTLQENYPQFTEADLRAEMLTLYATGADTLGSSTAGCLLALAQYQHMQERLYKEIVSVAGTGDEDITEADLSRMPYLDQVIKETLRRFNVVPYIMRRPAKDIALSTCTIPAGTTIAICLAGIHWDPKNYPEPFKFDPERFAPDKSGHRPRLAYMPFSGGARNCIGKTYAMQLMKLMVVHTLRRYKVTTDMDVTTLKTKFIVTLIAKDGYNIRLQPRA